MQRVAHAGRINARLHGPGMKVPRFLPKAATTG
jgi:hypothetical protein